MKKISRIGQWKNLWEKRIDQMEKVWKGMMQHEPVNEFDRMFFESFPYYMAIAENAIQYLVDTELDDDPKPLILERFVIFVLLLIYGGREQC